MSNLILYRRLVEAYKSKLVESFNKWKEMKDHAVMEENLNQMKKSAGSSTIGQKLHGLINLRQKDAFNALLEHKRETDIKKRAIKMILNTNYVNMSSLQYKKSWKCSSIFTMNKQ